MTAATLCILPSRRSAAQRSSALRKTHCNEFESHQAPDRKRGTILKQRRLTQQEAGQASLTIIVVLASVVIISILLVQTMNTAVSIKGKADTVEANAAVINQSGDSIPLLVETNKIADSILVTAAPLESKVKTIENLALNIDKNAATIDATAATIVGTAGGINAEAIDILATARSIDTGAKTITGQVVTTVNVARSIKEDTGEIVIEAQQIHRDACALPQIAVNGINDGHCQ